MTDPVHPREMSAILTDQFLVDQILKTNKVFDDAAAKLGQKFTHILWTNDKTLIPETVKYFISLGFEVREMRELKSYDNAFAQLFDHYLADFKGIGVACDAARMIINYDLGGLYLDMDAFYPQYSAELHYIFDFWGYYDKEFYQRHLSTWSYGSIPGHPIHKLHLKYLRKFFRMPADERPFFLNRCYFPTSGVVLFLTGPFYYTIMGQYTLAAPDSHDFEY